MFLTLISFESLDQIQIIITILAYQRDEEKKKVQNKVSHGFSSIAFVSLVLVMSLIIGISIGCLLLY